MNHPAQFRSHVGSHQLFHPSFQGFGTAGGAPVRFVGGGGGGQSIAELMFEGGMYGGGGCGGGGLSSALHSQTSFKDPRYLLTTATSTESGSYYGFPKPPLNRDPKLSSPGEGKRRLGDVTIVSSSDGTRLYCCPECHMAFPDKVLLEPHLATHKIERRFVCGVCGASLKRKEHLDRHQLSHSDERPYSCVACPKTFKRNEHLARHYVVHSGEKAQVCPECGKAFYRKDHLRKHAAGHLAKRLRHAAIAS